MSTTRSRAGLLAALALMVSALMVAGTTTWGTSAGATASGTGRAGSAPTAYARAVHPCTVPVINVRKGRLEGAAGSRFQTVRVTNEGSRACSTPGWTRYRFFDGDGLLGHRSARNPGYDPDKAPVVIRAGQTARSVLSWVDPGPVPKRQCRPRPATGFRVSIAGLPGHYVLRLDARVCTTKKYRPHGTRLTIH